MNKKKIITLTAGVIIVAGAAVWLLGGSNRKQQVTYEMVKVGPADISNFVTATGTIEPVTEVEVGTQVSGIIDKIYVDYNTIVKEGQLIALMDKVTLESELASSQATYDGAKAEYEYQLKNYERNKGLKAKNLISDTDYELSEYNYLKAKSAFDSSKAALSKAERNLSYATITSPIDGVVISKDVEEGQFLFAIALLDQLYWIIGSAIGALLGSVLPIDTTGIDFAMTALFVVIMVEQWMESKNRPSVLIGLGCGLVCLLIFGADNFILPTMICIMLILLPCRKFLDKETEQKKEVEHHAG